MNQYKFAKYAHDNDLIDKPGRKQPPWYVNNTKKMKRLLKADKANQLSNTANIKFGVKIPREHKEAMMFDSDNGNTNCKDAEILELKKIYNFYPFESLGTVSKACIPLGNTKIQVYLIYNYKKYGRYKECMVASGNMTGPNLDTYYSSFI